MTAGPDQAPAEVPGQLSPVVLDQLDGQLSTRRAEREAERKRAAAAGGPCSRCGAVESWQAPGVGGWPGCDQHGAICHPCDVERGEPSGDDRTHRIRAARLVLGDTPAPAWAGHGDSPAARWWHDDYLASAMVWWYEVMGSRPGQGPERFGYLSGPELVARLYQGREPQPPTRYSRGRRHRCPSCGAKGEVWAAEQVGVSAPLTSNGELSRVARAHFRVTWTCTCGHTDVEERAEQLAGVPVRGPVG
jgi:hypothetical protein